MSVNVEPSGITGDQCTNDPCLNKWDWGIAVHGRIPAIPTKRKAKEVNRLAIDQPSTCCLKRVRRSQSDGASHYRYIDIVGPYPDYFNLHTLPCLVMKNFNLTTSRKAFNHMPGCN